MVEVEGVYPGTANGVPIVVSRVSEEGDPFVRVGVVRNSDGSYSKKVVRVTGDFKNLAEEDDKGVDDLFREGEW